MNNKDLIDNIHKLHTTALGAVRIRKNLGLTVENVVDWCRERIESDTAFITRKGKNWYIDIEGCRITVNAYSYTLITAHKISK